MQQIETGRFNDPAIAKLLITLGNDLELNAEKVIDQYALATGRDVKAQVVTVSERAKTPAQPALPKPPPRALVRTNGQGARPGAQ